MSFWGAGGEGFQGEGRARDGKEGKPFPCLEVSNFSIPQNLRELHKTTK